MHHKHYTRHWEYICEQDLHSSSPNKACNVVVQTQNQTDSVNLEKIESYVE